MDTIPSNTRTDVPRLLNVNTVATIVGLTAWGVKHLHRAGKLRGKVQAGRLYWHSADVGAYVERFRDDAARRLSTRPDT
jgi:hypothetical protein